MTSPLRFGVLGAARISGKAILKPAIDTEGVEVCVIAARDTDRAVAQAEEFGIPHVVDTYDELLASDIDAVYNPLPISLHHEWTIKALRAGKHVLCEKPFASNAALAAEMVAAGEETGLVAMEGFHWRYHPFADRLKALLDEGCVGSIQHIDAAFTVPINPADDVRHSWELSGGALMDLGCYAVQWVRFIAGAEPEVVCSSMTEGRPRVDVVTTVDLRFADGITAKVHTAMNADAPREAWLKVRGSRGSLLADNPLAPHTGNTITISPSVGEPYAESVAGISTFHYQLEAFRDAVQHGTPFPTGGADSVATMRVIDSAYLAAGLPVRGT